MKFACCVAFRSSPAKPPSTSWACSATTSTHLTIHLIRASRSRRVSRLVKCVGARFGVHLGMHSLLPRMSMNRFCGPYLSISKQSHNCTVTMSSRWLGAGCRSVFFAEHLVEFVEFFADVAGFFFFNEGLQSGVRCETCIGIVSCRAWLRLRSG